MMAERERHSYQHPPAAECEACPWRDLAPGALGRAAQHHDRTGHTVRVELTRVVRYGASELVEGPPAGQEALTIPDDHGALF